MRRNIARRVERLELRAKMPADPPRNIFLCFGDDYSAIHAQSGQREWHRGPEEQPAEFEARIVADLKAAHGKPPFMVMLFG
jgi:hypothetical protein